jgi:poly-gamma-glutamate synthesis protein (capsule biosynthesis protein)
VSGIGEDLQGARAPAYCDSNGSRVALVSMAATFIPYARASRSRPDMAGRPGINPPALTKSKILTVSKPVFRMLSRLGRVKDSRPITGQKVLHLLGMYFRAGEPDEIGLGKRIYESDRTANLKAIREAKTASQMTVVAIHAHDERRPWLRQFARRMISEGADIVHVHGPTLCVVSRPLGGRSFSTAWAISSISRI